MLESFEEPSRLHGNYSLLTLSLYCCLVLCDFIMYVLAFRLQDLLSTLQLPKENRLYMLTPYVPVAEAGTSNGDKYVHVYEDLW